MNDELPHTGHTPQPQVPGHEGHTGHEGKGGHSGHRLIMIACCIPMLVIVGVLMATGAAGPGVIFYAVACTAMMVMMMRMMPGGRNH